MKKITFIILVTLLLNIKIFSITSCLYFTDSNNVLFQFLKLNAKNSDTSMKVLYISGNIKSIDDSIKYFAKQNKLLIVLNKQIVDGRKFVNNKIYDLEDSLLHQTFQCIEVIYNGNNSEVEICYGHSDITFEFAVNYFAGYENLGCYKWNILTKTFTRQK